MSCRDRLGWRALLAHRFAETAEPADWPGAQSHLAECASCRSVALTLDPTLVFLSLPEPRPAASDGEAMRQAVAELRRARALQAAAPSFDQRAAWSRAWPRYARFAAAAALLVALGSQLPANHGSRWVDQTAALPAASGLPLRPADTASAKQDGLLVAGDVGRPDARIYEIGYRDMAVVMVVDKSLDL